MQTAWRHPKEQRPGTLHKNQYRELPEPEDPDAEPPCTATRSALVVFGKQTGKMLTVCTDLQYPIHDPREAARRAAEPEPEMPLAAAADIAFCVAAYSSGMDEDRIAQALANDYLSRDPSPSTRAAYIRRTMTKARDRVAR